MGKKVFTWLSLVMSLMASFCVVLFPRDFLDEIWDLIEPVSEGEFSYLLLLLKQKMVYPQRTEFALQGEKGLLSKNGIRSLGRNGSTL